MLYIIQCTYYDHQMKNALASRGAGAKLVTVEVTETEIAPLDPEHLGEMATEAMRALLAEGESDNTIRSYQTALRYWSAWFGLRYRQPIALPVSTAVVLQFIVDHAQRKAAEGLVCEMPLAIDRALVGGGFKAALGPPALATLVHRVSVLSTVHQLRSVRNPCHDPKVRELLAKTRRAYSKRGVVQDKKPALTKVPLEALLATCDNSFRGLRDRALLLFAWSSGGRRRSEVTAATTDNVRKISARTYVFTLHRSKTDHRSSTLWSRFRRFSERASLRIKDLRAFG